MPARSSASATAFIVDTIPRDGLAHGLWFDSEPPQGGRPEQPDEGNAEGISLLHIAIVNAEERNPSRL